MERASPCVQAEAVPSAVRSDGWGLLVHRQPRVQRCNRNAGLQQWIRTQRWRPDVRRCSDYAWKRGLVGKRSDMHCCDVRCTDPDCAADKLRERSRDAECWIRDRRGCELQLRGWIRHRRRRDGYLRGCGCGSRMECGGPNVQAEAVPSAVRSDGWGLLVHRQPRVQRCNRNACLQHWFHAFWQCANMQCREQCGCRSVPCGLDIRLCLHFNRPRLLVLPRSQRPNKRKRRIVHCVLVRPHLHYASDSRANSSTHTGRFSRRTDSSSECCVVGGRSTLHCADCV